MSIRHGLLALLDDRPRYGYQLRAAFETRTGGTWPLNIGQVYTTLGRLERDGLVTSSSEDDEGHVYYALTGTGRAELRDWFATPVDRTGPPRNELAIKLAMAVGAEGVDVREVIQGQRRHTITAMQDYTRLKVRSREQRGTPVPTADDRDGVAWMLLLEQLIFQAEAEIRWLDHCETQLARIAAVGRSDAARSDAGRDGGHPAELPAPTRPAGEHRADLR
jgi:DNA-binding PadR family transcriptional regulator